MPLNLRISGREISDGVAAITLALLSIAVVNLMTKPAATIAGVGFSGLLFPGFVLSEKQVQRKRGKCMSSWISSISGGGVDGRKRWREARQHSCPGERLLSLYPLEAALRRAKRGPAEIVVLHVRMLRRGASGEYDLEPGQLFSTIEQLLFTKVLSIAERHGKPVRLAVVATNDLWEGILRTASNLQSSSIVAGSSAKMVISEQAREIGFDWERLPDLRPRVTIEPFTPSGQEQIFYLGPHAPRLTFKEIDLLHKA